MGATRGSAISSEPPLFSGLILAGGAGRRVGGRDKGWIEVDGVALARQVHARLAPQVDDVVISANRNQERYAELGTVVGDQFHSETEPYAGPLAGLAAGLAAARHEWVLCVPCDTPALPTDLGERLWAGRGAAPLAVARSGDQLQPTLCLLHRSMAAALATALASGSRQLRAWQSAQGAAVVDFPDSSAFANFNHGESG